LTVSDARRDTDMLFFHRDDNHPNPTALSVCRESRAIALKKYRLCFGTPNIYANLSGRDILYFGRRWDNFQDLFGELKRWETSDPTQAGAAPISAELSAAVISDL
jgi:hypothetical protein